MPGLEKIIPARHIQLGRPGEPGDGLLYIHEAIETQRGDFPVGSKLVRLLAPGVEVGSVMPTDREGMIDIAEHLEALARSVREQADKEPQQ